MARGSFKANDRSRPSLYRTPSPPRRHWEAISPTAHVHHIATLSPHRDLTSYHVLHTAPQRLGKAAHRSLASDSTGSGLEAFASIALATTETANGHGLDDSTRKQAGVHKIDGLKEEERPPKRSRTTEYPERRPSGAYPSIRPHGPSGAQEAEAELLLNFAREVHSEHQRSASISNSEKFLSPTSAARNIQPFAPTFDESPRRPEAHVNGDSDRQQGSGQETAQSSEQRSTNGHGSLPDHHKRPVLNDTWPISHGKQPLLESSLEAPALNGANMEAVASGAPRPISKPSRALQYAQDDNALPARSERRNSREFQDRPTTSRSAPMNGFLEGIEDAAASHTRDDHSVAEHAVKDEISLAHPTKMPKHAQPSYCAACNFTPDSLNQNLENPEGLTSWINCDNCKDWFHYMCAGFASERHVRSVDKYHCKKCERTHGLKTTYVRQSNRAHNKIDYAGLNEGILKTSSEDPEHHYIKHFKSGNKWFQKESFPRMRSEEVTAEVFARGDGMKTPIVISAEHNPQPSGPLPMPDNSSALNSDSLGALTAQTATGHQLVVEPQQENLPDGLDMIMPRNLTVRQVAELFGPDEKIDVIDVKSQNGEDKKWNMRRWADYYEKPGKKVVRNVISLEVSHSALGQLVRRPKIVRDLDLQDSIWPQELRAKGEWPKVQMYCLMSVADCFTDFHIDFGGSSVFYHILKGKKTFFFIPPHEKHLKKYEDWCNSQAQNETFLGEQTKECYRVDLSAGDTMLIPAGWIHAVWTPEDSLVIGGNFLTRMHYHMQIRVAQIEKATKVARKFRYPHFQKILWYAALRYLDEDPLPESVKERLASGDVFPREYPTNLEPDAWQQNAAGIPEYSHSRYYGKAELDGLPALGAYLLRTARIAIGCINEKITAETRNAVKRSIPKGHKHGEPLDAVKKFAMWYTWKRGNENIPEWAHPDFVPEAAAPEFNEKKLSARMQKKLERDAAYEAFKVAPERQSTRPRTQPAHLLAEIAANQAQPGQASKSNSPAPPPSKDVGSKRKAESDLASETPKRKRPSTGEGKDSSPRQRACETCRKARRACKHRNEPSAGQAPETANDAKEAYPAAPISPSTTRPDGKLDTAVSTPSVSPTALSLLRVEVPMWRPTQATAAHAHQPTDGYPEHNSSQVNGSDTSSKSPGRAKACETCRRSKVRVFSLVLSFTLTRFSVAAYMTPKGTKTRSRRPRQPCHGPLRKSGGSQAVRSRRPQRRRSFQQCLHSCGRKIQCPIIQSDITRFPRNRLLTVQQRQKLLWKRPSLPQTWPTRQRAQFCPTAWIPSPMQLSKQQARLFPTVPWLPRQQRHLLPPKTRFT